MEENIEKEVKEQQPIKEDKISKKEKKKIHHLEDELAKAKLETEEWKNKYYLAHADIQNTKKQYDREHAEMIKYRSAGFIENLMPALDSFHLALKMEVDDPKIKNFLMGFEYIYKGLISALENEGVVTLEPHVNDKFDGTYMHALDAEESDLEPNTVIKILSVGYKLKDRVIRPAMVIVSKKRKEKTEEAKSNEEKKDTNSSTEN